VPEAWAVGPGTTVGGQERMSTGSWAPGIIRCWLLVDGVNDLRVVDPS